MSYPGLDLCPNFVLFFSGSLLLKLFSTLFKILLSRLTFLYYSLETSLKRVFFFIFSQLESWIIICWIENAKSCHNIKTSPTDKGALEIRVKVLPLPDINIYGGALWNILAKLEGWQHCLNMSAAEFLKWISKKSLFKMTKLIK